eukprot:scaffold3804_cov197-Pinguiococcus_pyrenoidosus.AAC.1
MRSPQLLHQWCRPHALPSADWQSGTRPRLAAAGFCDFVPSSPCSNPSSPQNRGKNDGRNSGCIKSPMRRNSQERCCIVLRRVACVVLRRVAHPATTPSDNQPARRIWLHAR